MKTSTKTSTKTKTPTFSVSAGVGFDATPSQDGYGFAQHPAIAIASHPLRGMRIYGPFLTPAAAWQWIDDEGHDRLSNDMIDSRGAAWFVERLDVPRDYQH